MAIHALNREYLIDVLGLGCVAIDDLLYVASFPPPNTKVRVLWQERQCGGLTGTALVAASRLGAKCTYAGVLGDDELSLFVLEHFRREGIDVLPVIIRPDARPIHSTIIVEESGEARNVFFNLNGVFGADDQLPDIQLIHSARVLFIDHFGAEGMIRAARIAREGGIPVVADFESDESPRFAELLRLVDHLLLSEEFARKLTRSSDPETAAERLWNDGRKAVVVTCGENGCWYLPGERHSPQHLPAFRVKAVDTTGCGDVFHGAYASALARDLKLIERLRFAAAAAALKAMQRGGQQGIPTRFTVEAFLKERE